MSYMAYIGRDFQSGCESVPIGQLRGLRERGTKYGDKVNTVLWLNAWTDSRKETSLAGKSCLLAAD